MKGKLKFNVGLIVLVVTMIATIVSLSIGTKSEKESFEKVFAAGTTATVNGEEFSAKFDGNILFSVEKVSLGVEENGNQYTIGKELYTKSGASESDKFKQFQGNGGYYVFGDNTIVAANSNYYFNNIANVASSKYVVKNGEFVMLNNAKDSSSDLTNGKAGYDENNNYTKLQDAIMISLGQYIYETDVNGKETVTQADASKTAGITYLNLITATHNGKALPNLKLRTVDAEGGPFYDFVYVIPQIDGNEGYYQFQFEYMVGGSLYTGSFEFYLLFKSSYTQTVEYGEDGAKVQYHAEPVMGWGQDNDSFVQSTIENGFVRYEIGKDGIDSNGNVFFPTLTYDYSKYNAKITHIANRKQTIYEYNFDVDAVQKNSNGEAIYAPLACTITNSEGTTTKTIELSKYDAKSTNNIMSILLTEQGTYQFEFSYIYTDYNYTNAPEMNLLPNISEVKPLSIHGFELEYSRLNHTKAQFAHYALAQAEEHKIDLIVPFGVEEGKVSDYKNQAIGFTYGIDTTSNLRVGTVVKAKTQDTLINNQYSQKDDNSDGIPDCINDFISRQYNNENVRDFISGVKYLKTNQSSIWFDQNDEFGSSFYLFTSTTDLNGKPVFEKVDTEGNAVYYDTVNSQWKKSSDNTAIAADSIQFKSQPFNNEVSFNKTGYYIVCINIKYEATNFYQIFAFQYSTDTIDINVKTDDEAETIIGAGRYTNKAVNVSWVEPGRFEKAVTGYYYQIVNNNADRDTLLKQTANEIAGNEIQLGADVAEGQFVKYLIKVQNEGDSATYKMFTIDKSPITGVNAYAVQKYVQGNAIHYEVATDRYGNSKALLNAITDSFATLNWADKKSGATIKATYTFTPFVRDSEILKGTLTYGTSQEWLLTDYKLGTTIGSFEFTKPNSLNNLDSSSVKSSQGIYVFTLTDDAGNSCKYIFVIDSTKAYFKIWQDGETAQYYSNDFLLVSENVNYSVGDYKAFKLESTNEELNKFITALSNSDSNALKNLGYFWQDGSNYSAVMNLFNKNGADYYLTVKNDEVAIKIGTEPAVKTNLKGKIEYNEKELNGATSIQAKLLLKGANNLYSSKWAEYEDADSYMSIEINKDNSRGMVYFSDNQFDKIDNFPTEGQSDDTHIRLFTGTDRVKEDGSFDCGTGIQGARATSSKYVGFVWNLGSGIYEVGEVSYQFYSLNTGKSSKDEYYYYEKSGNEITVYKDGVFNRGGKDAEGERGWFSFSDGSTQAQAGLYVVTRKYKEVADADYGEDKQVLNYYFIIDRNGIITEMNGQNILLNLMDTEFKSFSTVNTDSSSILLDKAITSVNYNIYLKTTKLPATIQIPLVKYYSEKIQSTYYAGQLKFELYFTDSYNQYDSKTVKPYKIFEGDSDKVDDDGFFKINIYDYLTNVNIPLRDKLIASSVHGDWISLPGRYVLVISDNVVDVDGENHTKLIGFEIQKGEGPQVDFYSGFTQENMAESNVNKLNTEGTKYSLTTSDEYIRITLPIYKENETNPQVDPNYLIVKQYYGSDTATYFINYPYGSKGGYNITEDKTEPTNYGVTKKIVEISADGTRYIYLDTMLRNANGVLNDLSKTLKYEITIRYKLNDAMKADESSICYFYYNENGDKVYFYETTYTITIDRIAPSNNVEKLVECDRLIQYYNQENGTESMFEHSAHPLSNEWVFTYEYKKYYDLRAAGTTDPSRIYALRVTAETEFSWDGLMSVKYRAISDYSMLKFPIDEYAYTSVNTDVTTYGALLLEKDFGYYEILERDEAGNTAQYVVCFTDGGDYLEIPISYVSTSGETDTVNINTSELNQTITAFSISANGEAETNHDDFYRLVIKNSNTQAEIGIINTNQVMIKDGGLTGEVVSILTNAGKGNYLLTISSRTADTQVVINLYDSSEKPELDIEKLIVQSGGIYQIVFANANIQKDGIIYYAKEISISDGTQTYTYICDPAKGYQYHLEGGTETVSSFNCLANTTYTIIMTDVFGTTYSRSFNTDGKDFYSIEFENALGGSETELYYKLENIYYTFTNVTINYDTTLFPTDSVTISTKENGNSVANSEYVILNAGEITLKAIWRDDCKGGVLDITVTFAGDLGTTYHIVIDTSMEEVALRDYSTGEKKEIKTEKNVKNPTESTVDTTNSGIMNLSWERTSNEYFDYTYTLFEHMKDDSIKEVSLNEVENQVINTADESEGRYHFVLNVYAKGTNVLLGNKVFTFDVQAKNNQLFYVQDSSNTAIVANSTFKFSELGTVTFAPVLEGTMPSSLIPLYVSKGELRVILTEDANVEKAEYTLTGATGYSFRVVKVKASIYEVWFGLLEVQSSSKIVTDLKLVKSVKDGLGNETEMPYQISETDYSKTIVGKVGDTVCLRAKKAEGDYLLSKNNLFVDVYYNGDHVAREEFSGDINYEVKGNGSYSFVISDLAGNVHKLNGIVVENGIDVSVMREVIVTINGEAPIENAFYNDAVEVRIFASTKYVTGSIIVKAFKNGVEITPTTTNPYIFEEYGTYRVEIEAKYDDPTVQADEPYTLTKTIVFTIVNVKEARQSIDLTSLSSYKIESILNPNGEDVTEHFRNNILNEGMLLTYEKLMEEENRTGLKISAGKITFTLTYSVNDGIYPEREVEFKFTMNNEMPSIDCSLETGKSSTKGFDITFNAGIIYEQIGESYIYINDEIAYHITEASSFNLETVSRTFKENGAGDYYIQLRSSSGNVLSSYKVTIKEPLNSWAIIIIVVASILVVSVITVIIVLRRKMRIR